jgi:hypothetical protein
MTLKIEHCHGLRPAEETMKLTPYSKHRLSIRVHFLLGLLACVGFCHIASAQVETGDILGKVTDASHAVVQGAIVTVTNIDTGVARNIKSNSAGEYLATAIPAGRYTVKIESEGFETYSVPELNLSGGDRTRVDASLVIGASVTVDVGAVEPQLQTDSSVVGVVVTERQVEDLPLDGRNFMQLAQILAGTNEGPPNALSSGSRPDDRRLTSSVSANGQDENANNQLIDGLDNNERIIGGIGVRPDTDAIQEFRVQTNLYTAEVGRAAGAIINIITKAGTNNYHGTVYEFFRNDIFDATNYFALTHSELRQNQYGASFGAPIKRNKLFYFVDYEGFRQVMGATNTASVPTCFEQQSGNIGNFSDISHTSVPGSAIDPIGLAYFQLYPQPNVQNSKFAPCSTGNTATARNYVNTANQIHNSQVGDGRVDYALNNGDRAFARYTLNQGDNAIPGSLPITSTLVGASVVDTGGVTGAGVITGGTRVNGIAPGGSVYAFAGTSQQLDENAQIDFVHLFSQNLVGEFRAGYTYIDNQSLPLNYGTNLATTFGLQGANTGDIHTSALTPVAPQGYASVGDGIFLPLNTKDNTIQGNVQFTLQHGKQSIKWGSSLIRRHANAQQSSYGAGMLTIGTYTGGGAFGNVSCAPLGCLLRGLVYEAQRSNQLVTPGFRVWEPSGYVQDDWRIHPRLTLNLGLRYDVFTPFTEAHNRISNFDPYTATLLVPGVNAGATAGVNTDYSNIAPRVGFAFSATPKTVFRGGFGLTYIPINSGAKTALGNAPYVYNYLSVFNTTTFAQGLPIPTVQPPFNLNSSNVANFTLAGINPNYKSSYIEQFNLTMQQEIRKSSFQLTYVGEVGHRLRQNPDVNLAPPSPNYTLPGSTTPCTVSQNCWIYNLPFYKQFPNLTSVTEMLSEGYSSYNSLQATVLHRFTNDLGLNANYTWAHGLNNAPNYAVGATGNGVIPSQLSRIDYGDSDLDVRNRFAMLLNYSFPFGKTTHGLEARLIKGWQTNLIWIQSTGLPFSITSDTAESNTGVAGGSERALLTGDPSALGPGGSCTYNGVTYKQQNVGSHNFYFNDCAFTTQTFGTYVPSRRNLIHGPHARTVNLSVFKTFAVHDNVKLQFRVESFNLTNTPTFNNPDSGLGDSTFGQFTATRYGYNPRELQFALKLLF